MARKFSFSLYLLLSVTVIIPSTMRAETPEKKEDHSSATPEAGALQGNPAPLSTVPRADGDADKVLKEKSMNLFETIFSPIPKDFMTEQYAEKLPPAVASAKDGEGKAFSTIITPLFGTLNNLQFSRLVTKVDEKIKEENESAQKKDGVTDNRFMDLLDLLKKYSDRIKKFGQNISDDPEVKTDKDKALAELFKNDFEERQKKNKALKAEADEINKLKKENKPENKERLEKLQQELLTKINQKTTLAFIGGQHELGNDANKLAAKELFNALTTQSESGHNFMDTFWKGAAERLHFGKDATTADKMLSKLMTDRKKLTTTSLAPQLHEKPKDRYLNEKGEIAEGVPQSFKFERKPVAPAAKVEESKKLPPPSAPTLSAQAIKDLLKKNCTSCHNKNGVATDNGANNLKDLRFTRDSKLFTAKAIIGYFEVPAMAKLSETVKATIRAWAAQQ